MTVIRHDVKEPGVNQQTREKNRGTLLANYTKAFESERVDGDRASAFREINVYII